MLVVRLRVASRLPQVLLAKWVAAWRVTSSQVEGAPTQVVVVVEVEAPCHAEEAWKSIGQLS